MVMLLPQFAKRQKLLVAAIIVTLGVASGLWLPAAWQNFCRPVLTLESDVIEFGNISNDQYASHTIQVRNTGRRDLVISNIGLSCGCLSVKINRSVIPPDENAEVSVLLKSRALKGRGSEEIILLSNDADTPRRIVKLYYTTGSEKYQFSPSYVDFGTVEVDSLPVTKTISVAGENTTALLTSAAISTGDQFLTVGLNPQGGGAEHAAGSAALAVTLNRTGDTGQLQGAVRIGAGDESYVIPVRAYVRGQQSAAPRTLLFGPVSRTLQVPVQTVRLSVRSGRGVGRIESVTTGEALTGVITINILPEKNGCDVGVDSAAIPVESKMRKIEGVVRLVVSNEQGVRETLHVPILVFLDANQSPPSKAP